MYVIYVKDNIVSKIVCGDNFRDVDISSLCDDFEVYYLLESIDMISVGDDIRHYIINDNRLVKKSNMMLVKEGLLVLDKEYKIDENDNIVRKSLKEMIDEGIIVLKNDEFFCEKSNNILKKSKDDLYLYNVISKNEYVEYIKNEYLYKFIIFFKSSDDYFLMRLKRKEMGLWTDEDEMKYEKISMKYKYYYDLYEDIKKNIVEKVGEVLVKYVREYISKLNIGESYE